MKAPSFWYMERLPFWAKPLGFLGNLYGFFVKRRIAHTPGTSIGVPVVCVGNLTVGGVGKTPLVQDLARRFLGKGKKVGILSRGYGGRLKGPIRVNTTYHQAKDVGDEPLLLAKTVPTWMAKDRVEGALLMKRKGLDLILMDDGHQNPTLHKNVSIVVVDGVRGFGNGHIFPGGPLRESVESGLRRAHAVIVVGTPNTHVAQALTHFSGLVYYAQFKTDITGLLPDKKYMAFAGIGHPQKFFQSLESQGLQLAETRAFPDHHMYTDSQLFALKARARKKGYHLITTEKDYVRLSKTQKKDVLWAPLTITWKGNRSPASFILKALDHVQTD